MDVQPGLLIIDDEPGVLGVLRLVAQRAGLKVWAAPDGESAIDLYRQHRDEIDLVLSDVNMPTLDGPSTVARLRQESPDVRFCFMSGFTSGDTAHRLLALGAERLFEKPFAFDRIGRDLHGLALERPSAA